MKYIIAMAVILLGVAIIGATGSNWGVLFCVPGLIVLIIGLGSGELPLFGSKK